jgi:hypothetical protein
MALKSIIPELVIWATQNSGPLAARGVQLTEKFPEPGSKHPWKASIALKYDGIIASYTVVMEEGSPSDPTVVPIDMNAVAKKLIDGSCRQMKSNPKLTIS